MKAMFHPENIYTAKLKSIDDHLPYIAFVRFTEGAGKSRGMKPFELFDSIFNRKFY